MNVYQPGLQLQLIATAMYRPAGQLPGMLAVSGAFSHNCKPETHEHLS
jgi:hypothetical protein